MGHNIILIHRGGDDRRPRRKTAKRQIPKKTLKRGRKTLALSGSQTAKALAAMQIR
jgi:hypothetical protein